MPRAQSEVHHAPPCTRASDDAAHRARIQRTPNLANPKFTHPEIDALGIDAEQHNGLQFDALEFDAPKSNSHESNGSEPPITLDFDEPEPHVPGHGVPDLRPARSPA